MTHQSQTGKIAKMIHKNKLILSKKNKNLQKKKKKKKLKKRRKFSKINNIFQANPEKHLIHRFNLSIYYKNSQL